MQTHTPPHSGKAHCVSISEFGIMNVRSVSINPGELVNRAQYFFIRLSITSGFIRFLRSDIGISNSIIPILKGPAS